jgi:hypothetical protein
MKLIPIVFSLILIGILIWAIVTQVKEHHKQNDPKLRELKKKLEVLHPVVKDLDFYEGERSYTINKEKVYLCLKDENGNYYNDNMLMYVLLHEISHSLCDEIGHTEKFHDIFEDLLKRATAAGLYNPSLPLVKNYCEY